MTEKTIEDRYYKINRILLKLLGIWPYRNSKWARVQTIIIRSIFLSGVFVQLTVFATNECNMNLLVDVLSFTFPTIFVLLIYEIYDYNIDIFKGLFESIYNDWEVFNTKMEFIIMSDYANTAKLFTRLFSTFTYITIFVVILTHAIPITLDIILPLNESRKQNIHVTVEYFVDPSKHYILIVSHLSFFICLAIITVMVTSVTFLSFGFHACALFKLTNYHVEAMIDENVLQIPSPRREHVIYEKIVFFVAVHQRALRFCKIFVTSLDKWFLFIVMIGIASLSINMFRVLMAIIDYSAPIDIFIPGALVSVHFCYMFFGNHIGQRVTDHNIDIFDTIYKLPWYNTNSNVQKLLLFLLTKGSKPFYLSLAGLINVSYECFTMLLTSAISYFTVIYSFR